MKDGADMYHSRSRLDKILRRSFGWWVMTRLKEISSTITWSVTFRGKEVHNPFLRKLVVIGIVPMAIIGAVVAVIATALTPIWVPLHFVLRLFGRRGFIDSGPGRFYVNVGLDGFRKA